MAAATKRVAIIGGGVSGLAAAWHLHTNSDNDDSSMKIHVELFEAVGRLGGHAHTLTLDLDNHTATDAGTNDVNKDTVTTNTVDIDVGFMVYNPINYPNMTHWFSKAHLNVPSKPTDMALAVSLDNHHSKNSKSTFNFSIEWASHSLSGLIANPANLLHPSFYLFLRDLLHFNSHAHLLLLHPPSSPKAHLTIRQYLQEQNYSEAFATFYLVPMMAALWSASVDSVWDFPARSLVEFMCNHRMLQLFDRPMYQTPAGRSIQYTQKMTHILGERAHVHTPIVAMHRNISKGESPTYELFTEGMVSVGVFHEVVFACHAPTAWEILQRSQQERKEGATVEEGWGAVGAFDPKLLQALSKIEYGKNVVYVHSDPNLMPKKKAAWASWNCMGKSELMSTCLGPNDADAHTRSCKHGAMEGAASGFGAKLEQEEKKDSENGCGGTENSDSGCQDDNGMAHLEGEDGRMRAVYVTYYINRLQNLNKTSPDIFVSLNPHIKPRSETVFRRQIMAHPQFTHETHEGRDIIQREFQGINGLWFCGAYMGYGFHEDGCRSGFEVATAINGVPLPWVQPPMQEVEECSTTKLSSTQNTQVMVLPPPDLARDTYERNNTLFRRLKHLLTYRIPVFICRAFVTRFLKHAITIGELQLKLNDGTLLCFGDKTPCGEDPHPVTARVFDDWFFVKVATEYDLGLARSFMAGHFLVEPLPSLEHYPWTLRRRQTKTYGDERDETNDIIGDPIGLTRLFLLFVGNRDCSKMIGLRSSRQHTYANALQNASGLAISKMGSLINYLRFKLFMDNSEKGGSLRNIHAHYDLSNDLFRTFLDKETLMYSSAIYEAVTTPSLSSSLEITRPLSSGLLFKGSLEEAQWRKLDTLCGRAQLQPGHTLLDIGFGWGGLSIYAAKKYGCRVTGVTLSVEQKALAEERVHREGLDNLISFEVVDYRIFARRVENRGKFDRVISCEMIEAVGHEHLGEFFWAVEQVLKYDGVLVMEAITTPEARYETYLRTTDFINTIIFPGGIAPSLHALVDASYKWSTLTLEHIDNIGLHYAETLAEWRRRFNANERLVRKMGFDDVFLRLWNYYFTYCEAGFRSQTENCVILVFSRPGNRALIPLSEARSVTQMPCLSKEELDCWLN